MNNDIRRVETYLSPKFAAAYTKLSKTTLRRLLRHGTLTEYRTRAGHRRFALTELQALRRRMLARTAP